MNGSSKEKVNMTEELESGTIMVVDDIPANLKLLQETLQAKGYRVLTFPSGKLALRAAAGSRPDLILLDIKMPEMNGFEVCTRLKEDAALKEIPVLFISTLTATEDKIKAFSVGGVDYVTKPFQIEEVYARTRTHLRLRKLQADLAQSNLDLEARVQEQVREIADSHQATIIALAKLAECRDDDTGAHVERTQAFCRILAETLREHSSYADRIDSTFVTNIYYAASLHDIGKVGIMDHILLKPGKHTPEEFAIMKTHTTIGAKTLESACGNYPRNAFLNVGIVIARSHHEKWDGSGYPDGLAGEAIPLPARIMAVADVYDALRSIRPYKRAFTHEASCTVIQEGAGQHFDPTVVDAFRMVEAVFAAIRDRMHGGAG
jgi:putative two-component system response regulator